MKTSKIFAVIVAYNPNKKELIHHIDYLFNQVEFIVIVNNSKEKLYINKVNLKIIELGDNYGIAYAQNVGMQWSYEHGAEFVIQLDQDSIIQNNTVNELFHCYQELSSKDIKIGLVGSQDFDKDTGKDSQPRLNNGKRISNSNYYEVYDVLSSGSLIPKFAYYKVGRFKDELFIDAVDSEFCWRLRKHGFKVIKNKNAKIAHKLGNGEIKKFCITLKLASPFRLYYQYRNFILLFWVKYVPIYWKYTTLIRYIGKIFLFPIFVSDWKERLKFITLGIFDGIKKHTGKM